jgi:hypothetical protein
MAVESLFCKGLGALGWKLAVGTALTGLTFFGTVTRASSLESADFKTPCWDESIGVRDNEIRPFIEEAREILSKLLPTTAVHLRRAGEEFDLERNLRIQESLFREDLEWLNRGYSERQIDLMVFVAVASSLERIGDVESALCRTLDENLDPDAMRKLKSVALYRTQAIALLRRLSSELDDVSGEELRFHY